MCCRVAITTIIPLTIKFSESITHTHMACAHQSAMKFLIISFFSSFTFNCISNREEKRNKIRNEHISKIRDLFILSIQHSLVNFNIKESFKWPKMPKKNCKATLSLVLKEDSNKINIFFICRTVHPIDWPIQLIVPVWIG